MLVSVMEWEVDYENLTAWFNNHKTDHSEVLRHFLQSFQLSASYNSTNLIKTVFSFVTLLLNNHSILNSY